jgi:hypothetical protein
MTLEDHILIRAEKACRDLGAEGRSPIEGGLPDFGSSPAEESSRTMRGMRLATQSPHPDRS